MVAFIWPSKRNVRIHAKSSMKMMQIYFWNVVSNRMSFRASVAYAIYSNSNAFNEQQPMKCTECDVSHETIAIHLSKTLTHTRKYVLCVETGLEVEIFYTRGMMFAYSQS